MKFVRYLFLLLFLCGAAVAQTPQKVSIYDVDLKEQTPYLPKFLKEYEKANSQFDSHYRFRWRMSPVFDRSFKNTIRNFGTNEVRIDNETENRLLLELKRIPKEFYPYLGPKLHTLPGLSGKILDLPGIKETKHKFPERIASAFRDIEGIEYLSPGLYIFLMPEVWGENLDSIEFPNMSKKRKYPINARVDRAIMQKAMKKIKLSDFVGKNPFATANKGIRNFNAGKYTPLSAADVQAVALSFDELNKMNDNLEFLVQLISFNSVINYWDEKNGVNPNVSYLKTVVNPCQSIVRKFRWLGKYAEFQEAIGKQGFGLEDWAYTCDKTVKAYRVATLYPQGNVALKALQTGYYDKLISPYNFTREEKELQNYFMNAILAMYETTEADVDAVRPNLSLLSQKLPQAGTSYLGSPFVYNP